MVGPHKVDVIAATGGFTSLEATERAANETGIAIPIVFLGDKAIQHTNISGGRLVKMLSYHQQRVNELRDPRYNATRVGLLVNLNAGIGGEEDQSWNRVAWGPVHGVGRNEDNDRIRFRDAIRLLVNDGADGIVVASDSFFTSKKNQLVRELNDVIRSSGVKAVCYPFDSYKDENPESGKSMRFGVDLAVQYRELGVKAKDVLAALRANPGTIPNVGIDPITSAAAHW